MDPAPLQPVLELVGQIVTLLAGEELDLLGLDEGKLTVDVSAAVDGVVTNVVPAIIPLP